MGSEEKGLCPFPSRLGVLWRIWFRANNHRAFLALKTTFLTLKLGTVSRSSFKLSFVYFGTLEAMEETRSLVSGDKNFDEMSTVTNGLMPMYNLIQLRCHAGYCTVVGCTDVLYVLAAARSPLWSWPAVNQPLGSNRTSLCSRARPQTHCQISSWTRWWTQLTVVSSCRSSEGPKIEAAFWTLKRASEHIYRVQVSVHRYVLRTARQKSPDWIKLSAAIY